jgi:hypothetical protein
MKDKYRQEYLQFKESPMVKTLFDKYEKALQGVFDIYSKFEPLSNGTMSYSAYMKMGQKAGITPAIVTGQDYIYIFKTLMKQKKQSEIAGSKQPIDSVLDIQGTRLSFPEFKEALLKISCLGKYNLGGMTTKVQAEEIKL